jgi:hypothetical protein
MATLLSALPIADRLELLGEVVRLQQAGRWNARTEARLGALVLALGHPDTRAVALDRWHAADCDCLLTGYGLIPWLEQLLGDRRRDAQRLALHELQTPVAVPPAAPPPPAANEPELLPVGFRIAGQTLMDNTRLAVGAGDPASLALRAVFADAIRAHRAGTLAAWMAEHPDATIGG